MSGADNGLLVHLAMKGDLRDAGGRPVHNRGVKATADGGEFDGRGAHLEVPGLEVGRGDLAIAAWIRTEPDSAEYIGDIIGQFDPSRRRGFALAVVDHAGVTSAQANYRNPQFFIDSGTAPQWTDCGRPGNAVLVYALAVHEGQLYAGTFEHGAGQTGHVWRYDGPGHWTDCRVPCAANSVSALVSHGGKLYAACGMYDSRGSALEGAGNANEESRVWCLEPDGRWSDCGVPPGENDLPIMGIYRGRLYATMNYRVGLYRYEGGTAWSTCAEPLPRFFALAQWRQHLYAGTNAALRKLGPPPQRERIYTFLPEAHGVYRYDDRTDAWTGCGRFEGETQMYSFAIHRGMIHVGTWPSAKVLRSATGKDDWEDCGRVHPEEKEIMGMAVYNGMLYAGTLPAADVYRLDGAGQWTMVGHTDRTPNVVYRRAWSMAVHDGQLFVGTLPSGHVFSMRTGQAVGDSHELGGGWQHLAAVRSGNRLRLYVNGALKAESAGSDAAAVDAANDQPLRVGFGPHDYFTGAMRDVRVYGRALAAREIAALSHAWRPGGSGVQ